MAGKRKLDDVESREMIHESRQTQVFGSTPVPAKKPRRFEPPVHKQQIHSSSVNAIKKRLRDVSRRLQRAEDLPANVRIENERAFATYQQELADAEAEKLRQKMIKKYHMVRFFERQKATRLLKKLRKSLLTTKSTEEVESLKEQMHIVEVDLNYTQFYPLSEPYISLYPQKGSATEKEDASTKPAPKPPMWAEVERCMEGGTLSHLRNREGTAPVRKPKAPEIKPTKPKSKPAPLPDTSGLNRRERRRQQQNEGGKKTKNKSLGFAKNEAFGMSESLQRDQAVDGNESDGGFFEE